MRPGRGRRTVRDGDRTGSGRHGSASSGRLVAETMLDGSIDTITLTLPADDRFRAVPTLVLGGIGTRFDLPYERMDDLQLAILSLLEAVEGEEATVSVVAGEGSLAVSVGPLRPGSSSDRGLKRVVSRLVDGVDSATRDGAEWMTVRLAKPDEPQAP